MLTNLESYPNGCFKLSGGVINQVYACFFASSTNSSQQYMFHMPTDNACGMAGCTDEFRIFFEPMMQFLQSQLAPKEALNATTPFAIENSDNIFSFDSCFSYQIKRVAGAISNPLLEQSMADSSSSWGNHTCSAEQHNMLIAIACIGAGIVGIGLLCCCCKIISGPIGRCARNLYQRGVNGNLCPCISRSKSSIAMNANLRANGRGRQLDEHLLPA